jgi:hypothetical protein
MALWLRRRVGRRSQRCDLFATLGTAFKTGGFCAYQGLLGEILQRWQQSEHTHQPPIGPMSVGFFVSDRYGLSG